MLEKDIVTQDREELQPEQSTNLIEAPTLSLRRNHSMNSDNGKTKTLPVSKPEVGNMRKRLRDLRSILCAVLFGAFFGFCMNKGTVFMAPTIRMQMLFQRFAMLKMFLAAVGVSMLSVALLVLCCNTLYSKILAGYIEHNSRRGILHYIWGGSLIGLGMVVCGSCPGTVFVQVGSGILNSAFTCLGGLFGTYFYYVLVHERVSQVKLPATSFVLRRICDIMHVHSVIAHTLFGVVLIGAAIGLEFLIPWRADLNPGLLKNDNTDPKKTIGSVLGMVAWSPSVCGAGVGLLQLFFIYFLDKSLGVSSAFTVLAAQLCRIKVIARALPSLASFTYGLQNYLALLFALGAIGGSALSSSLSHTIPLGAENGTNIFNSIFGGFLLLLGARCAGGCTSGQGISGMTHLLIGSFITTACIFGSGILFALSYFFSRNEWFFQDL